MAHLEAVDISQYQGTYKDYGTPVVIIKVSGGDNGVYYDSQAANNYNRAVADGKAVGMYHFAGGKDPIVESNFFVRACSPLAENDVMVLDWEVSHPDPVGWCKAFVENVHAQTGVWPLLYVNLSTLRAHDWSPVLANCGLWLAAWNGNPEVDINTGGVPYVMQQYQGSPLDRDAWFGTLDQFKAYGYHTAAPAPAPEPAPVPVSEPAPVPTPVPESSQDPVPVPEPPVIPPAPEQPQKASGSWLEKLINWFLKVFVGRK
jgi:lysozyme